VVATGEAATARSGWGFAGNFVGVAQLGKRRKRISGGES